MQPFKTVHVFPEFSRIVHQVENLEKFGHYNVTVLCLTAPGDGPKSEPIEVITFEDGEYSNAIYDFIFKNEFFSSWVFIIN